MILKSTIRKFFKRKRDDWRPYKALSLAELQRRAEALPVQPPIWYKLLIDQKRCFLVGAQRGRFGFHLDTGMGKTLLSLALVRYYQKLRKIERALVLVPNLSNKGEWRREVEKHTAMDCLVLSGSTANKWHDLEHSDADVIVETYGGLMHLLCEIEEVKRRHKTVNKMIPQKRLVYKLAGLIDGLVLDESTYIARKGTLPYRLCRALGKGKPLFIELTGTPFGRDPEGLWSQIYLLDEGHTLGESLGLYRAAFYDTTAGDYTMFEYAFNEKKSPLLHQYLAHCTLNVSADEASLPALVADIKTVEMTKSTQHYYDLALREFRSGHKAIDGQSMRNSFIRMRQISSGFVGYKDELGKGTVVFPENPKLDVLVSIVEHIPKNQKVIVFHDFNVSGELIAKRFKAEKIGFVRLWGGTRNHEDVRETFEDDPDCQCLVMSMAGAYGLNLQIARYGIFFESPVPVITRKQAKARFIRQHSKHKTVFLIDLVMEDTQDERILEFHEQGADLYAAIIKGDVDGLNKS